MSNEELRKYVYEQHIAGVQDTEIARHLGLTVEELAEKLEGKPKQSTEETVVWSDDFKFPEDEKPVKQPKQPKNHKDVTEI